MKNRVRRIAVFHYHLLPGGVTSVIALSCEALAKYLPGLEEITLVTGDGENAAETAAEIEEQIKDRGVGISTAVLPDIGYVTGMPQAPSVAQIKTHLRRFDGFFWWIHNYHLGKNPQFTQALLEILEEKPDQQILFHIHDFPECARYENLQRLNSTISLNPYPRGRNVRYALINGRDRRLLRESGMAEADLFLLNNPVRGESGKRFSGTPETAAIRRTLAEQFGAGRTYDPAGLHLFYPVRTIRRKNILEAGALSRLMALELERPCNLIVTLPGRSASERRYSAAVEGCFSEGLIPGLWGIGRQAEAAGIPFSDLGRSCDMIVASSVQEGFGYLFVEALQWGLPLFARDLDILEGIRKLFDPASAGFYNELKTPIIPREAQGLRERYRKKLLSLEEQLTDQFPRVALKRLGEEIGAIGADGYADFALFGVEDQIALLRRMESPGFVDEFAALNRRELKLSAKLLGNRPAAEQVEQAETQFSFQRFADQTTRIFESYGSEHRQQEGGSQDAIIDAFARLRFLLLLYDYNGDS